MVTHAACAGEGERDGEGEQYAMVEGGERCVCAGPHKHSVQRRLGQSFDAPGALEVRG